MKTGLLRSGKLAGGLGLLLALVLILSIGLPVAGNGFPNPPHYFHGSVSICGTSAPEGTLVEAKISDVVVATSSVNATGDYGVMEVYGVAGNTIQLWVMNQMLHSEALEYLKDSDVDLLVRPTLTTASTGGGDVATPGEPGPYGPYDCGTPVNIVANPDGGYVFVNWTGDVDNVDNASAADTFITMNGFYSIMANFEPETPGVQCTLTFDVIGTGSVTEPASSPQSVPCGDNITLLAVETDDCWEFDGWTADTTEGLNAIGNPALASTYITMDDDYSIHANFVKKLVTLDVDVIGTGSVTEPASSPVTDIPCGDDITLLAVETDGCWEFDGWTADTTEGLNAIGNPALASTYITMDGNYSIHANFAKKLVTLNVDVNGTGGTVTEPASSPVTDIPCGNTIDLFADPDTDYMFNGWTADTPEALAAINNAAAADTFITMNGNYSIHANFIPEGVNYCELTFDVIGTGSVTEPASSPQSVPCGNTIDLLAVETDPCWEFDGWTADTPEGLAAINNAAAADTFITMSDNYSIHANFALKQFTLTTGSSEGGDVTTPPVEGVHGPYDCGDKVAIVATATGCYNFAYWSGDNTTIDDPDAASTNITMNGNYSITAVFVPAGEVISISFDEGWNTFSTPISLHDCMDTWEEFIAANSLNITMIYGYDAASEIWVPVYDPDEIEPLFGYYVKTAEAGVAHLIPNSHETPLPTRDLVRGVSLIGIAPASLGDMNVVEALITLYEAENGHIGYTLVVSPYINNPDDWDYARGAADPPLMSSGRAYWVVMENDDVFVGSTTTPK